MFKISDIIVYGSIGTCEIIDITENKIGGVKRKYYVLKPEEATKNSIFVPVDNENLVSRMRPKHTKDELLRIIKETKEVSIDWIENTNERGLAFKTIIASGKTEEIIKLVRKIKEHKEELEHQGSHMSKSDERVFKEAISVLCAEFFDIMGINQEDTMELIFA